MFSVLSNILAMLKHAAVLEVFPPKKQCEGWDTHAHRKKHIDNTCTMMPLRQNIHFNKNGENVTCTLLTYFSKILDVDL